MPDVRIKSLGPTVGIALIALVGFAPAASASTIPVTTTTDEIVGTGAGCSLREAIQAANTNAIVSGCPAGQPRGDATDIIDVPSGTYTLTVTGAEPSPDASVNDLNITEARVTIQNTGGGQTTVNGNGIGRVFCYCSGVSSGFFVNVIGIRVTGGSTGGIGGGLSVSTGGTLNLINVTVDGNFAGGGGGGVSATAGSSLNLDNVTISGNNAQGVGNGGGVLHSTSGNGAWRNSTIVNNDAENGGGVSVESTGSPTISNTILADNTIEGIFPNPGNPGECRGTVNSADNNVVGTNEGCTFNVFGGGSDLVGNEDARIAANLSALADNGGTVLTRLPLRTSPAINRGYEGGGGTPCLFTDIRGIALTTDARGVARPQDGICDAGAVEAVASTNQTLAVNTTADDLDGVFTGTCSLREAVTSSNLNQATGGCPAGGSLPAFTDAIQLPSGTYTLTRTGPEEFQSISGDIDVRDDRVSIVGTGAGQTTIDGNGLVTNQRVLHVHSNVEDAVLDGVNIRNGRALADGIDGFYGGGIYVDGELSVRNSTVSGNSASNIGGGLYYGPQSSGEIVNSTISGNQALQGGGIQSSANSAGPPGGAPSIYSSTITQNTADLYGGGGLAGGQYTSGDLGPIANTIVAGNTGGTSPDCFENLSVVSQGFNLIGNVNGCTFVATTGDQVGTNAAPLSAGLGALADNGGRTLTHLLLTGSLAHNAGNPAAVGAPPACPGADQRGTSRPLAGRCDIGAVEIDLTPPVAGGPGTGAGAGAGAATTTGQRAAALKKCKKKKGRARARCKAKAKKLPV